jgi:hypothetical protein
MSKVLIRPMKGEDIKEVLHVENLANTIKDEYLDQFIIHEDTWTRQDFLDAANSKELGGPETKCFVAEMLLKADQRNVSWIYGSLIVSLQEGFWGTEHVSISPYAYPEIRQAFALHLIKMTEDDKRSRVYLTIKEQKTYEELKFWKQMGFSAKLLPGKFGDVDGWLLCYNSKKSAKIPVR